jgi:hypothetical protein
MSPNITYFGLFIVVLTILLLLRNMRQIKLQTAGYGTQRISRDCRDAHDVVRSIGMSNSVCGRVAKFLLASATDGRVTDGVISARLVLTHEDIAQLTGTCKPALERLVAA